MSFTTKADHFGKNVPATIWQKRLHSTNRRSRAIKVPRSPMPAWLIAMFCFHGIVPVPQRDAMAKAREAALKALQIDPNLAEAHNALGKILNFDDWILPELNGN